MTFPPLIRLSPLDNVAVAARELTTGEQFSLEGITIFIRELIPLGHKIALTQLAPSAKVLKYGMSIGSITAHVSPGDWVHVHNMKSDYLPAHLRDAAGDHA